MHRPAGEDTNVPINFTLADEDDFGYFTVAWAVESLGDGEYEIEARTVCPDSTGALPADFNFAAMERLRGMIDRRPPELFGLPSPGLGEELYPGQAVRFEFTEPLECARPHVFTLMVEVTALPNRAFDNALNNNLQVICEGRTIEFQFDPFQVDYTELLGSQGSSMLSGVEDLNGNPSDRLKPVTHELSFANVTLSEASVVFRMTAADSNGQCAGASPQSISDAKGLVQNEVASQVIGVQGARG